MDIGNDCTKVGAGSRACPFHGATTGGSPLHFKLPFIFLSVFLLTASVSGESIAEEKLRIVSQLPNMTEVCFELGLGDQLVGVTDYCNWPPEARNLPRIGGLLNPNFERVVSLKPDWVLVQDTQKNFIDKYKALGIKTLPIKMKTAADVIESIRMAGAAFQRREMAEKYADQIQSILDEVRNKAKDREPVLTLFVLWHQVESLREIYAAAPGSFHDGLLRMAGGKNCIESGLGDYPKVSKEAIIQKSPEAIIVLTADSSLTKEAIAKRVALWSPLTTLRAVQDKRIYILQGDYLFIPGPRMGQIAKEISRCLINEQQSSSVNR